MTQRTKRLIVPGLFLLGAISFLLVGLKQSFFDDPPRRKYLVFGGAFFVLGLAFLGAAMKARRSPAAGDGAEH